jgi:hypothetical protein
VIVNEAVKLGDFELARFTIEQVEVPAELINLKNMLKSMLPE